MGDRKKSGESKIEDGGRKIKKRGGEVGRKEMGKRERRDVEGGGGGLEGVES